MPSSFMRGKGEKETTRTLATQQKGRADLRITAYPFFDQNWMHTKKATRNFRLPNEEKPWTKAFDIRLTVWSRGDFPKEYLPRPFSYRLRGVDVT